MPHSSGYPSLIALVTAVPKPCQRTPTRLLLLTLCPGRRYPWCCVLHGCRQSHSQPLRQLLQPGLAGAATAGGGGRTSSSAGTCCTRTDTPPLPGSSKASPAAARPPSEVSPAAADGMDGAHAADAPSCCIPDAPSAAAAVLCRVVAAGKCLRGVAELMSILVHGMCWMYIGGACAHVCACGHPHLHQGPTDHCR